MRPCMVVGCVCKSSSCKLAPARHVCGWAMVSQMVSQVGGLTQSVEKAQLDDDREDHGCPALANNDFYCLFGVLERK